MAFPHLRNAIFSEKKIYTCVADGSSKPYSSVRALRGQGCTLHSLVVVQMLAMERGYPINRERREGSPCAGSPAAAKRDVAATVPSMRRQRIVNHGMYYQLVILALTLPPALVHALARAVGFDGGIDDQSLFRRAANRNLQRSWAVSRL